MLSYNGTNYTYNLNGDLLSKDSSGQVTEYIYDTFGALARAALPNGSVLEYKTYADNKRARRLVNDVVTHEYFYDQIGRLIHDGFSRFIYGSKPNTPDYMIQNGITYRIFSDERGSVRFVVNAQSGVVQQRMDYDSFGKVVADTNPGFQPFGFSGGLYEPLTGLVRFGARDYDAETGRWTSKDPIRFAGGDTNLYGYTWNDPVNFTDPDGRCPLCVVGAVIAGGAVVGGVSNFAGAILGGSTLKEAFRSAGVGAVAGAGATATTLAVAVGGAPSLVGGIVGIGVGVALQLAYLPTTLPEGASLVDVTNGLQAISNGIGMRCPKGID